MKVGDKVMLISSTPDHYPIKAGEIYTIKEQFEDDYGKGVILEEYPDFTFSPHSFKLAKEELEQPIPKGWDHI